VNADIRDAVKTGPGQLIAFFDSSSNFVVREEPTDQESVPEDEDEDEDENRTLRS